MIKCGEEIHGRGEEEKINDNVWRRDSHILIIRRPNLVVSPFRSLLSSPFRSLSFPFTSLSFPLSPQVSIIVHKLSVDIQKKQRFDRR